MADKSSDQGGSEMSPKTENKPCSYCDGAGEVSGMVDDIEFTFQCPCSGGNEEAVRWLLGRDVEPPPDECWYI
jgi:hypothetical protein